MDDGGVRSTSSTRQRAHFVMVAISANIGPFVVDLAGRSVTIDVYSHMDEGVPRCAFASKVMATYVL